MGLQDKIRHLIDEQGISVFKKPSIYALMNDYGCFNDESPAVKNIFKTLVQCGHIAKLSDIDAADSTGNFGIQNIAHNISNTYGYKEGLVSGIIKEYIAALGYANFSPLSTDSYLIPNNEIWYKVSSDFGFIEQAYEPELKFLSDNHLISNTYKNGKGVMVFADDLHRIPDCFAAMENCFTGMENGLEFFDSIGISNIILPSTITFIGSCAFGCCLTNINLENILYIDQKAFYGCDGLKEITLPPKLTCIAEGLFNSCSSLSNIIVPAHVRRIERWAFAESGLKTIVLPSGLNYLEISAFQNCKLEAIYFRGPIHNSWTPRIIDSRNCKDGFTLTSKYNELEWNMIPQNVKVYVPMQSVEVFKSDPQWSHYNIVGENF